MVTKKEAEDFLKSLEGMSFEGKIKAQEKWLADINEKAIAKAKAKGPSPFIREMREKVDELERLVEAEEAQKDAKHREPEEDP